MAFENRLQTADLIVLVVGILVSLFTGIFYSYKERKHVSSYFYHRGGGKLSAIPVAMSMLVTFESSIFFLGYPSEVYIHGFIYCWINIGIAIGNRGPDGFQMPLPWRIRLMRSENLLAKFTDVSTDRERP
ncbi:SC5A8-like protein [Mya arenaria]|uniref:SC5A8-like protein n=1 Tax=Mya arenaria TaxID=6604 RepID=A0ABY7FZ17_MYAAR|nr:SC5A8-like protein [Mya arenaria]